MEGDMPAADAFESMDLGFISDSILFMAVVAGLCALFLAITFLQSALDKLIDYKGNKSYFTSQFEKTFMKNFAGILLPVITIMELASGVMCAFGVFVLLCCKTSDWVGLGCMISACTLLCLLFGQRIAKDYAGAASITGYFMIAILGIVGAALS